MPSEKTYQAAVILLSGILGIVAFQALFRTPQSLTQRAIETPPAVPAVACIGDAIPVEYPFAGGVASPHECIVQCGDNKPRYILYNNGKGTQCETPPGCNDYGEDHGITCTPPAMTTVQSSAVSS